MPVHEVPACVDGGMLPSDIWSPDCAAEILRRAAAQAASKGITYHQANGTARTTYVALREDAERILGGLVRRGVARGDRLVLQLHTADTILPAVWACLLGGIVPAIVPVAARRGATALATPLQHVWQRLSAPHTLTSSELAALPDAFPGMRDSLLTIEDLRSATASERSPVGASAHDVALLLLTSGTTGQPKLVRLTHANIVASVAASAFVNGYDACDVSLNWLPLCHIGALMRALRETYLGCEQIQASTESVRDDPLLWFDLADEYRATMTWGPDAAFASVVARRERASRRRWRLSALRSLYWSGEPARTATMRAVRELLAPSGLPSDAFHVAWGMTEACFATSSRTDVTHEEGVVADCGRPVPGVSIRVVDDDDRPVGEGEHGHVQIAGPLVSGGYEDGPAADDAFTPDGWLRTGDLGAIRNGRLGIVGRAKDVIKIAGAAHASVDIEAAVEQVTAQPASAAAVAVRATPDAPEAVAVFVHAPADSAVTEPLVHAIRARVACDCGIIPRFVIPVASGDLPQGAAGKVQRSLLRDAFESGAFADRRRWPYDLGQAPRVGVAPTPDERALAERIAAAIGSVLHLTVLPADDLFAIGGSSLAVVRAAVAIAGIVPDRPCTVADVFQASSPIALAIRLTRVPTPSPNVAEAIAHARQRISSRLLRAPRAARRQGSRHEAC